MGNDIRLAALAALLSSLAAAHANSPVANSPGEKEKPAAPLPDFSELDGDGDGHVSLEEASTHPMLAALFGELDADRNGYLDMREFAQARSRLRLSDN